MVELVESIMRGSLELVEVSMTGSLDVVAVVLVASTIGSVVVVTEVVVEVEAPLSVLVTTLSELVGA